MTARAALATFVSILASFYGLLFAAYLMDPRILHFRGWEYHIIFPYVSGIGRSLIFQESGDSSRQYLLQRYRQTNTVTLNENGNRPACYRPADIGAPRLVALGDSQMFGSYSDDADTFPAQLCQSPGANIYNGGRRNVMTLLRVQTMPFDAILFATTERYTLANTYCAGFDEFAASFEQKLPEDSVHLPPATAQNLTGTVIAAFGYYNSYLASRLDALLGSAIIGLEAPPSHLFFAGHQFKPVAPFVDKEVACAKRLSEFFTARGYAVGFLYFPAHQTLYGREAGLAVDTETLSYLDLVYDGLSKAHLRTMDSKGCLVDAKLHGQIHHMHDTHLNADGYRALADCFRASPLNSLIARKN